MVTTSWRSDTHAEMPGATRPRRGWLVPIVAFAGVLVLLAGSVAFLADGSHGGNDSSVGQPVPKPTGPSPATIRAVPQETLAQLAARLLASPPPEAQGRYIYISTEIWSTQGDGMSRQRDESWYDPTTRRSYGATRQLPTLAMDGFRPDMLGRTDFSAGEFSDSQFTLPPSSVRPPLSDDPATLLRQANEDTQANGISASGAVDFVAGIFSDTYPSVRLRAAALTMLATIDGLDINEHAIDPLGRPGISITGTNSDGVRVTLIINPADGMALMSNMTFPGNDSMASRHWALYLASTRTDVLTLPTA